MNKKHAIQTVEILGFCMCCTVGALIIHAGFRALGFLALWLST